MPNIDDLRATAHHHRDRLALYRARANTGRPFSPQRLRELERASQLAEERLRHAMADARRPPN
jgi:hypothetical protein